VVPKYNRTLYIFRELDSEISSMQRNEKKLMADIKKHAKQNQMGPVKIMAKDLVRTRNFMSKFIEMKTQLNAVSLKLQTVKSHDAMVSAMKGVTKALTSMNKQMNLPGLTKIMTEFARENERADMVQETMGDALDDALMEDGSAAEVNISLFALFVFTI
jgi:charged multivesicular body protein 2A